MNHLYGVDIRRLYDLFNVGELLPDAKFNDGAAQPVRVAVADSHRLHIRMGKVDGHKLSPEAEPDDCDANSRSREWRKNGLK